MTIKDFDSVEFQRKRRAELSEEYNASPDKFKDELAKYLPEEKLVEPVEK